ncbi:hypothetical protein OUW_16452 [Mycobacteroides abscessus M93]|nr:hypothetical protein OUW_16452 [Mycobacteroides abscessus M93]
MLEVGARYAAKIVRRAAGTIENAERQQLLAWITGLRATVTPADDQGAGETAEQRPTVGAVIKVTCELCPRSMDQLTAPDTLWVCQACAMGYLHWDGVSRSVTRHYRVLGMYP